MKTTIMKTNFKVLAVTAIFGLLLNSCSSDDSEVLDAPVISSFEYGEGSTHSTDLVAYKGSDIHLEAVISAEAVVSSITLSIHAHDLTPGEDEVDWDFEQVFTDANYLVINPTFHEHVDIPNNIPAGEYHDVLITTESVALSKSAATIQASVNWATLASGVRPSLLITVHPAGMTPPVPSKSSEKICENPSCATKTNNSSSLVFISKLF